MAKKNYCLRIGNGRGGSEVISITADTMEGDPFAGTATFTLDGKKVGEIRRNAEAWWTEELPDDTPPPRPGVLAS